MTAGHVAIFVFPGYGHLNPTLEISRGLAARGHRVTYVLDERLSGPALATGAQVKTYVSRRGRLGGGALTGADIGALALDVLRESIDTILPLTLDAFRDDVPDLVLYDLECLYTARSAAHEWGCRTVQLFAYPATNEHYSLALEVFDGAFDTIGTCIELVTEQLVARGEHPDAVWSFMTNYDDRNIALLPREFQPMGDTFDERYAFVGHSLAPDRPGTGAWTRPPGADQVVLITLGTEVNDHPDFFAACGPAFAGDWHVVMATGPGNKPPADLPAHVEAHEWIPFRAVLPHASAVVCHAGMSTVLEAVWFGKPLVVVPYTPEEKVNARRVVELGLGTTVPSDEISPERLRAAVESVAGDPDIAGQVARMREAMLAGGGPERAVELIDGWLGEGAPAATSEGNARWQ